MVEVGLVKGELEGLQGGCCKLELQGGWSEELEGWSEELEGWRAEELEDWRAE